MTSAILLTAALFMAICVLAFALATYALPFMIGLAASRLATGCDAGCVFAAIAGLAVGVSSFAALVYLRALLHNPAARLSVAVIYAAPAAVAGYALIRGLVSGVQMTEPLREILCIASGASVAFSAALRLATPR